jgi:hypothetical protein
MPMHPRHFVPAGNGHNRITVRKVGSAMIGEPLQGDRNLWLPPKHPTNAIPASLGILVADVFKLLRNVMFRENSSSNRFGRSCMEI